MIFSLNKKFKLKLFRSKTHELWSHPMECLKLTVRELSHIRQVFSRAEIEKYHSHNTLYKLLSREQICFNCKIQRFSWVSWAHSCDICKAKVCKKCLRKVCSPTEEYLDAAAYMLYSGVQINMNQSYLKSKNSKVD